MINVVTNLTKMECPIPEASYFLTQIYIGLQFTLKYARVILNETVNSTPQYVSLQSRSTQVDGCGGGRDMIAVWRLYHGQMHLPRPILLHFYGYRN